MPSQVCHGWSYESVNEGFLASDMISVVSEISAAHGRGRGGEQKDEESFFHADVNLPVTYSSSSLNNISLTGGGGAVFGTSLRWVLSTGYAVLPA